MGRKDNAYKSFNGVWRPSGCLNGQSSYSLSSQPGNYLCYNSVYRLWLITTDNVQCGTSGVSAYSPTRTTDILGTSNNWQTMGSDGQWEPDNNVLVTARDIFQTCPENTYSDKLCIETNNTQNMWHGKRTFEVHPTLCSNEERIFQFKEYNESELIDGNKDELVHTVYFLHFHKELKYSDSNETVGQWLISKGEPSIISVAICERDNLLECTANSWIVESVKETDFVLYIIDQYMNIENNECPKVQNEEEQSIKNIDAIIVIFCGVVALIFLICICLIWWRCNKNENMKINQMLSGKTTATKIQNVESDDDDLRSPMVEVELEIDEQHDGLTETT